jgi:PHD/YefM family antitoxin component YafN of YafNO toxin-antitoxin module
MKLSKAVKPISYIKSHASEVIRDLESSGEAIVITLNGEAKAIIQDIRQYEKTQESLAMLKILALGKKEAEEGKFQPMDEAFDKVRKILKEKTR